MRLAYAQRSADGFDFTCKKPKILPFYGENVGKYETFLEYSCLFTMGLFLFDEIVSGNGTFQEL